MKKKLYLSIIYIYIFVISIHASTTNSFLTNAGSLAKKTSAKTTMNRASTSQLKTTAPVQSVQVGMVVGGNSDQVVYLRNFLENGITKNTFLCHVGNKANFEAVDCSEDDVYGAQGFNFAGEKTIQLFNNFAYWMKQKHEAQVYATTTLRYDDNQVDTYLQQQGWGATNGYCILISTDEILQKIVKPNVNASNEKVKVVVQLLYNGGGMVQLWSQDAALVAKNGTFDVVVSADFDNDVNILHTGEAYLKSKVKEVEVEGNSKKNKDASSQLQKATTQLLTNNGTTTEALLNKFIEDIHVIPRIRMSDVYNSAISSPRKVKIQVVT